MAIQKRARRAAVKSGQELDSVYLLKLVMYLIIGTLWVRFQGTGGALVVPLPVGLIIGLIFAMHDHFRIDRKIEYGVLLVAMLIGFWTQVGLVITL